MGGDREKKSKKDREKGSNSGRAGGGAVETPKVSEPEKTRAADARAADAEKQRQLEQEKLEKKSRRRSSKLAAAFGTAEISASELTQISPLGSGAFGEVFLGECRGIQVAIKRLKTQKHSGEVLETFQKEVVMMSKLVHPNINSLMGACFEPNQIAIVIEYCPNGCLETVLYSKEPLPVPRRLRFLRDIALGMN